MPRETAQDPCVSLDKDKAADMVRVTGTQVLFHLQIRLMRVGKVVKANAMCPNGPMPNQAPALNRSQLWKHAVESDVKKAKR